MKKFKLTKGDTYDLTMVMSMILREQAEKLSFQDILQLQKTVNYFNEENESFVDEIDKLNKEKTQYVENANIKITKFREGLQDVDPKKVVDIEKRNQEVDTFVKTVLGEAQSQIDKDLSPKFDSLYAELGKEELSLEVSKDAHKKLVDNFELFAKEKYNNKNKMIETYETMVSATD